MCRPARARSRSRPASSRTPMPTCTPRAPRPWQYSRKHERVVKPLRSAAPARGPPRCAGCTNGSPRPGDAAARAARSRAAVQSPGDVVAAPRGGQQFATGQGLAITPPSHRLLEHGVPGRTIRPLEPACGLGVVADRLLGGIPAELPAQTQRQVRQVAGSHDSVTALEVGDRRAPRLDAVEEVACMAAELVVLVARNCR